MNTESTQRPAKSARKFAFTRDRVDSAQCEPGKSQTLFWDTEQPGLGLRVTANGARAFVFESKLGRETIRLTIGAASMQIRAAKDKRGVPVVSGADTKAAHFAYLISQGRDPRAEIRDAIGAEQASRAADKAERAQMEVTGLMAWTAYCTARQPFWGDRNQEDHRKYAQPGGRKRQHGKGTILPGPLYPLLRGPLAQLNARAVDAWVTKEAQARPARAQLGFRLLRGFLNWSAEQDEYRALAKPDACKRRETKEKLGKPGVKSDSLQKEQLEAWFAEVRKATNPAVAAYLQGLLLVGARPEEWRGLRWEHVDFRWKTITIGDKMEGQRTIPLTPYVAHMMAALPRRNEWVFSSGSKKSKDGRICEPHDANVKALTAAGLPHVTLHGLRRSFGTISEWVECPVGVVAQIQGHKPSAIAEKHYRVRPIDLLRMWHERIEAFILENAKVEFKAEENIPTLRVVSAA